MFLKIWDFIKFNFLISKFFRDKVILSFLISTFILNGIIWFLWIWRLKGIGYPIYAPFSFFNLGNQYQFWLIPSFGLGILILNWLLGQISYNKVKLASYFLIGTAAFIQILILIFLRFLLKFSFSG